MIPASTLARLAMLGLSGDQAEAVATMLRDVEDATKADLGAALEARRANDRSRKARQRHVKSREVTGQGGTSGDNPSPKERSPTPPKETTPSHRSTKPTVSTTDIAREFIDDFWPAYPNKVGKPKAAAAFDRARRKATLPIILAGLQRYVRDKPGDRPWCNPETWLNQERWADQPAPVLQATGPPPRTKPMNGWEAILHGTSTQRPDEPDFLDITPVPSHARGSA